MTQKSRVNQWAGLSAIHQPPLVTYSYFLWPVSRLLVWEQKVEHRCSMLITTGWILEQFLHLWEGNKSVVDLLRCSVSIHEYSGHIQLHHNILYSPYPTTLGTVYWVIHHQSCLAWCRQELSRWSEFQLIYSVLTSKTRSETRHPTI